MKKCSVQLPTWSSFPQITCAGAVIRCKLSCSEWRDFSPAISLNTNAHTHTHLKKAIWDVKGRTRGTDLLCRNCCWGFCC